MKLSKFSGLLCALLGTAVLLASLPLTVAAGGKISKNTGSSKASTTAPANENSNPPITYKSVKISKETKDFIASIDGDVTLTVLSSETDFVNGTYIEYYNNVYTKDKKYYYTLINTLKTIAELNEYVKLEFVDPFSTTSYGFMSKYSSYGLKYGDLFLSCYSNFDGVAATRRDVLGLDTLFKTKSTKKGTEIVGVDLEKVLVNKLQSLRTYRNINVAYIKDLGSTENAKYLKKYLSSMRYDFDNITLKSEKLNGYDVIFIAAPPRDITLEEAELLNTFLDNGGNGGKTLVYMCSETHVSLPNLHSFLRKWGIAVREDNQLYCTEEEGIFAKNTQLLANSTGNKLTKNSDSEGGFYVMDNCTPLSVVEAENAAVVTTLLETKSQNVREILREEASAGGNNYTDNQENRRYPLLTLSQGGKKGAESNVVVSASVNLITNYMAQQTPVINEFYRGELNGNLAAFSEIFESLNSHHRNEESGLGKYAVTLKDMGYDTTSGLRSNYIINVAMGSAAGFVALFIALLIIFRRRKSNVGNSPE